MKKTKENSAGIFVKLVAVTLLLVILPLAVLGVAGNLIFMDSIEKETITSMQNYAANKLDLMVQTIEAVKREATTTSNKSNAISALKAIMNGEGNSADSSSRMALVSADLKRSLEKSNGLYENMFFADYTGKVVMDAIDGKSLGIDITQREYYLTATKSSSLAVSDVSASLSTGRPNMVVAVPMYDEDKKFIGMFCIPLEFNKLTEMLIKKMEGSKYNYVIFNSQSFVIAHENKELIFKSSMLADNESQKLLFAEMNQKKNGYGFYELKGVQKIMAYANYPDKNWFICAACTVDDFMGPVNTFRIMILLLAAACLLGAAIIAFFFSRSISNPLKHLSIVAAAISTGDLTQEVRVSKSKDEIGKLSRDFYNMLQNLRHLILEVSTMSSNAAASSQEMMASSEEVSKVSEQIATAVNELAEGASEQAAATERGNTKIVEVVNGLNHITGDMSQAEELTESARETVEIGKNSVRYQAVKMAENKQVASDVSNAIGTLSQQSAEIGGILGVIKSISDQTNLLSLNAAIEAARAGEQGRGFAVVAEEIRKLAEQSGHSVKRIESIIKEVQTGVERAVSEMDKTRMVVDEQEKALNDTVHAFENIEKVVTVINENIRKVADVSKELDSKAKEAGESIGEIAGLSEETASGTEEVAASAQEQTTVIQQIAEASESLSKLAVELQNSIGKFTL